MKQVIECVPNISEGRDISKINQIAQIVETVKGVQLLDVDTGHAANRTVITFVGSPEAVVEAAFILIKKASELIDMRMQTGEHPRFGVVDVCPLIPISGITLEETVNYAHQLGKRVGNELNIPGYFYENAAKIAKRRNLANCRSGEYEGLHEKFMNVNWKPDFGPIEFNESVSKTGAVAISARNILIAYNVNLNTTSSKHANAIASDIRESGKILREGNLLTGKKLVDSNGKFIRVPGKLKAVKAIGWYIKEFDIAQVSYNLTNISVTSMHQVFDESCKAAKERGLRVTGSEFELIKQKQSLELAENEKIRIAIKSLGLDDLAPFNPRKKVIEYLINDIS